MGSDHSFQVIQKTTKMTITVKRMVPMMSRRLLEGIWSKRKHKKIANCKYTFTVQRHYHQRIITASRNIIRFHTMSHLGAEYSSTDLHSSCTRPPAPPTWTAASFAAGFPRVSPPVGHSQTPEPKSWQETWCLAVSFPPVGWHGSAEEAG